MTAHRLVLSTSALELLRREVLTPPLDLPPGFALRRSDGGSLDDAHAELRRLGVAVTRPGAGWSVHPSVAGDLQVLAAPDLAAVVRAARPGLEVTACLALSGPRGASLLRTHAGAAELSAFRARDLSAELARVVPAPVGGDPPAAEEVPLSALLDGSAGRLRGRVTGTLHAGVVGAARPGRSAGAVGSVEWVWDGQGWVGLQPLAARDGRPQVRLVPVGPADLAAWLAPLLAGAAA